MPNWVNLYVNEYFQSSSGKTPECKSWQRISLAWLKKFMKKCKGTDLSFRKGHFEWYAHFKVYDQWWYMYSGDVRFKIMKEGLIRKCAGPKDYTGEINQWIPYNDRFELDLFDLLMRQS